MTRKHVLILATAALSLIPANARADYVAETFNLVEPGQQSQGVFFPTWGPPGTVEVQAYDGNGAPGGGLQAGQVRLTFYANLAVEANPPWLGVAMQSLAFNTNLHLSSSQIQLPTGWQLTGGPGITTSSPAYWLGWFRWGASTTTNIENGVSILISGLGANAVPSNFVVASWVKDPPDLPWEEAVFAANTVQQTNGVPTSSSWLATNAQGINGIQGFDPVPTPEPSTFVLAAVAAGAAGAAGGLLGYRRLPTRRRVAA